MFQLQENGNVSGPKWRRKNLLVKVGGARAVNCLEILTFLVGTATGVELAIVAVSSFAVTIFENRVHFPLVQAHVEYCTQRKL